MRATRISLAELTEEIGAVPDPEVPVVTIADLGVLRSVDEVDGRIVVTITPTYSGCPAMHHIEQAVRELLTSHQIDGDVNMVFSPAWTTEWMSEAGRTKLREYGIAPPRHLGTPSVSETAITIRPTAISCPQCASSNTELISQFGSTACKSLRRCLDCLEPFDHFKEF